MRKSILTIVIAMFGSAAVAAFSPAAARMTLSQCIGKHHSCEMGCYVNSPIPPGLESLDPRLKDCINRCGSNHTACVDRAMTMSPKGSDRPPKPTKGGLYTVMPGGGLLESGPGFNSAGPAAAGTVAPKPLPSSGVVIR